MKRGLILWLPLIAVSALAVFFIIGMERDRAANGDFVQSAMVGQKAPEFALPAALSNRPALKSADLADGRPRFINFFASWCLPCIAEAPALMQLSQAGVRIEGIAVRDMPHDTARFLRDYGNPFASVSQDKGGQTQLQFGSAGQPETFLISGKGVILYQHIGDIRAEHVPLLMEKWKAAQ